MFNECRKLKEIKGLNNFNTSKFEVMNSLFQGCGELESLDLSNFDTSNVIDFENMFNRCRKLKEIKGINKFNTSKATIMNFMFQGCMELKSLDLSNFDTSKAISICYMFNECFELEFLNLSNFNTNNVLDMKFMFNKCYKLKVIKGINNFNFSNGNTTDMFEECFEFEGFNEIMSKLKNKENQNSQLINPNNTQKTKILVYFCSTDQYINYAISCYNTEPFKTIEDKLYSRYPQLKNSNPFFLANGSIVNKSLTLAENKIVSETHILINYSN